MIYGGVNDDVVAAIPVSARTILDVGCGDGSLGRHLKAARDTRVVGLTSSAAELAIAEDRLDRAVLCDLESFDFSDLPRFDCIVYSHVLEHLRDPAAVLQRGGHLLEDGGVVVIALPNALYWRQRLEFLRGRFRYTKGGIMDGTHLRFFDWQTATQLVGAAGLVMVRRRSSGGFPGTRFLPRVGKHLDQWALAAWPGMFGVQFVLVAKKPRSS